MAGDAYRRCQHFGDILSDQERGKKTIGQGATRQSGALAWRSRSHIIPSMTILITGAGLVASHVARELQLMGEEPVLYDVSPSIPYLSTVMETRPECVYSGDITDLQALTSVLEKKQVSTIVHTAGLIGANVSRQPFRGFQVNVEGSMAVAEAARVTGVKRIIFCSTMAVYDFEKIPSKGLISEDSPIGPKNLYAATKVASEHLLAHFGRTCGIQIVNLRLAGIYGRGQYLGGSWMGRVVNRVLEACLTHQEVSVMREWLGINEYIYVKDVARAVGMICRSQSTAGVFNVGCGVLHTFDEFIAEIRRIVPDSRIIVAASAAPTVGYLMRDQPFDVTKAKRALGFQARFSLETGLIDYLDELGKWRGTYPRLD